MTFDVDFFWDLTRIQVGSTKIDSGFIGLAWLYWVLLGFSLLYWL